MKATDRKVFTNGISTVILLSLILLAAPSVARAQNSSAFTSTDTFNIPEQNGSIRFVTNGSYASATLQNNTWKFTNLAIDQAFVQGNLSISVRDSQVIVYQYFFSQNTSQFGRLGVINLRVDGEGQQVINLGLNLNRTTHQSEWAIIVPTNPDGTGADFLAEGKQWRLLSDNSIELDGILGNVTVAYFGFGLDRQNSNSNLPFTEQHSVAIATIIIVTAIIAVAAVISIRGRRKA